MLLLTPLLRLAGHVGALLSDMSTSPTEEPVGLLSPLLALVALSIFFLGLDFDEEAALELDLLQQMRRESDLLSHVDQDACSEDSQQSVDSWGAEYADDPVSGGAGAAAGGSGKDGSSAGGQPRQARG